MSPGGTDGAPGQHAGPRAGVVVSKAGDVWRSGGGAGILNSVAEGRGAGRKAGSVMGGIAMASIVLADDDEDLRALYAPCLRGAGHTVWEAPGGLEALGLVRKHRPDLLILDVWMPQFSGFEVLAELRHDPASSGLKVMMLSNMGDADTRLECFEMGAAAYVVKGLSLLDLRSTVAHLLADGPRLVPLLDLDPGRDLGAASAP